MDPIEQAIRRALSKGDADDRAFRERVYRSAFTALDKSLKDNPELTVENAIKRRKALQARIAAIETEYLPAMPPEPVAAPVLGAAEPRGAADPALAPEIDPVDRASDPRERDWVPAELDEAPRRRRKTRAPRERRKGGWLRKLLVLLVVLVILGIGGWWAFTQIRDLDAAAISDQLADTLSEGSSTGGPPPLSADGGADADEGWTDVFDPEDIQRVDLPGDATAQALEEDGTAFIRIRTGASSEPVLFAIGQGVLERFAGRTVDFNVLARGADGSASQMSVECDFGAMGACGRTRFAVGPNAESFLFQANLADAALGDSGAIAVVTDIDGEGVGVEVLDIRMRPAE